MDIKSFNKLVIGIVVLAIVVAGIIIIWKPFGEMVRKGEKEYQAKPELSIVKQLIECTETHPGSSLEKIKCLRDLFKNGANEKICERLYYESDIERCYDGAAIAKEKAELCKSNLCKTLVIIKNKDLLPKEKLVKCKGVGIICYQFIFDGEEYKTDLCDSLAGEQERDNCYYGAFLARKDKFLCEEIKNQEQLENCYLNLARYQKNESFCNKLGRNNKSICYTEVAVAKENVRLCDEIRKIKNIGRPERKIEMCYGKVIIAKRNEKLCDDIREKNIRDDCYAAIAKVKKSEELCERAGYKKEDCYWSLALMNLDPDLCKKTGSIRGLCYFQLAKLKVNEDLCKKAEDKKKICYIDLAIYKRNADLCKKLEERNKNECYYHIAPIVQDEKLCEKTGNLKESCYADVAVAKGDEKLCEGAGRDKDFCYFRLAKIKEDKDLCEKAGRAKEACYRFFREKVD